MVRDDHEACVASGSVSAGPGEFQFGCPALRWVCRRCDDNGSAAAWVVASSDRQPFAHALVATHRSVRTGRTHRVGKIARQRFAAAAAEDGGQDDPSIASGRGQGRPRRLRPSGRASAGSGRSIWSCGIGRRGAPVLMAVSSGSASGISRRRSRASAPASGTAGAGPA
jgi:hypothetical protein